MTGMQRAAFFDRDGTINEDIGYLHRPEDIRFVEGAPQFIRRCNELGYVVVVVTNQSGIARGMYSEDDMHAVHRAMNRMLRETYGAHIDAFYFCPHLEEITGPCDCRKPKPGLFLRAIRDYDIDPARSISFGDSERDEQASRAAGVARFVYVDSNHGVLPCSYSAKQCPPESNTKRSRPFA